MKHNIIKYVIAIFTVITLAIFVGLFNGILPRMFVFIAGGITSLLLAYLFYKRRTTYYFIAALCTGVLMLLSPIYLMLKEFLD